MLSVPLVMAATHRRCGVHLDPLLCSQGQGKSTHMLMLMLLAVMSLTQESQGFSQHFGNSYKANLLACK